jgi:hypothetical protein
VAALGAKRAKTTPRAAASRLRGATDRFERAG